MKNRTKLEIIYDILKSTKESNKLTHVIQKANLSTKSYNYYLNFALRAGLVENGKVTVKGNNFIKSYESLISLLK